MIASGLLRQSGECVVTSKIGSGGIDNRPVQVSTDRGVKRAKDSADAASSATAAPAATENEGVSITDSARQLAALEQAIGALPDVDNARVAKVRASIADGSYQVAPERIADKLLRVENDLSQ
jgi:negative regulator of flagellin synthesis FlgM